MIRTGNRRLSPKKRDYNFKFILKDVIDGDEIHLVLYIIC